jgi:hypothetical protein
VEAADPDRGGRVVVEAALSTAHAVVFEQAKAEAARETGRERLGPAARRSAARAHGGWVRFVLGTGKAMGLWRMGAGVRRWSHVREWAQ